MYIRTLKITLFTLSLYIAIKPWGTSFQNIIGYMTLLSVLFLPFSALLESRESLTSIQLSKENSIFLFLIFNIIISFVYSLDYFEVDFEFVKSVLTFICMYAAIAVEPHEYTREDLHHIFYINKLLSLIFVLYTWYPFSFRYTLQNKWGYYAFTLSLGNTNATSLQVFMCIILTLIEIYAIRHVWVRIIDLAIIGSLLYTLELLQCRTIMLCSILVIIPVVFKNFRMHKWQVFICACIPIISIFVQMMITNEDFTIMGKGLITGREKLYESYFETIKESPVSYIFGSICQHQFNNYHNGPFAILMNLGIVGLVAVLKFWVDMVGDCIEYAQTRVQMAAIIALCVYLIHSSTEAAPMVGMLLYGTPIIVMFRIARDVMIDYDMD